MKPPLDGRGRHPLSLLQIKKWTTADELDHGVHLLEKILDYLKALGGGEDSTGELGKRIIVASKKLAEASDATRTVVERLREVQVEKGEDS